MQSDVSFRNKMVEKFNTDSELKTLKNHIVYVVMLYIMRDINDLATFTSTEITDIDIMINAIPYFEHLSKNQWTIEDIEAGTVHTETICSIEMTDCQNYLCPCQCFHGIG